MAHAVEQHVEPAVHQAFGVHALAHARFVHQVGGHLLQHSGADAAEHVVGRLALQNDGVDAGLVQQLAEQQAGRTCTDDGNLGTHVSGFTPAPPSASPPQGGGTSRPAKPVRRFPGIDSLWRGGWAKNVVEGICRIGRSHLVFNG
ncbi:hypothetical protein FQZ97_1027850 [compost metagenome]